MKYSVMKKNKQFPIIGQTVIVLFLSEGFIPVTFIGRCIETSWNESNSTILIADAFSRQQFYFFSPFVFSVRIKFPSHYVHNLNLAISDPQFYEKKDNLVSLKENYDSLS